MALIFITIYLTIQIYLTYVYNNNSIIQILISVINY